jgi:hypothetical protein
LLGHVIFNNDREFSKLPAVFRLFSDYGISYILSIIKKSILNALLQVFFEKLDDQGSRESYGKKGTRVVPWFWTSPSPAIGGETTVFKNNRNDIY